jgi:hypothetical protein
VSLGSGSGKSNSAKSSSDNANTQTVKLRFLGADGKGLASKTGFIYAQGVRTKVTTDGDGNISADVDPATDNLVVRLWEGDFPQGASRTYSIAIAASMPDASSPAGVMTRLANLGYHRGAPTETLSTAAILRFQRAHAADGLKPTGELDDATKKKLSDKHGS